MPNRNGVALGTSWTGASRSDEPAAALSDVAHRDLVADAEDRLLRTLREPCEGGGVTCRRFVEALAAGEAIGPRVRVLPLPVVGERLPFELADPDVVQVSVDDRAAPLPRGSRARAARSPAPGGSAR